MTMKNKINMLKKHLFRYAKRFFSAIQKSFFYQTTLSEEQLALIMPTKAAENINRSRFTFIVISVVIVLQSLLTFILKGIDGFATLVPMFIAKCMCVVLFAFLLFKVAKRTKNIAVQRLIVTLYWLSLCVLIYGNILQELNNNQTVYTYILSMIILATIPFSSFKQAVLFTGTDACVLLSFVMFSKTLQYDDKIGLIAPIVTFSLLALLISQVNYSIFLRAEKARISVAQLNETDALTKILNRRGINKSADTLWQLCLENQHNIATFMIDIDDFKSYNDTFGHVKGDACLEIVADSIKKTIGSKGGIIGRYGGERIIVAISNLDETSIINLAKKIKDNIWRLHIASGDNAKLSSVSVSIGVYDSIPIEQSVFKTHIDFAEQQLLIAKSAGKECACYKDNIL